MHSSDDNPLLAASAHSHAAVVTSPSISFVEEVVELVYSESITSSSATVSFLTNSYLLPSLPGAQQFLVWRDLYRVAPSSAVPEVFRKAPINRALTMILASNGKVRYFMLEIIRIALGFVISYQLLIFPLPIQRAFISLTRHASAVGCVPVQLDQD